LIKIKGQTNFKSFNYKIPGDPSSAAFFVMLTILSKKSSILIKNCLINKNRIGFYILAKKMGAKISFRNKKNYKGEKIADIYCESSKNLKSINLPKNFNNSSAIDEFISIFIIASFSKGISTFKGLEELNKKESPRLDWSFKILNMIGIKTKKIGNHGIKIYGNPNLKLNKKYIIKNYLKDHRIAMNSIILALARGGVWRINDTDSIKTSFPTFLKIIKFLGGKYEVV
jgi:5-enolpyruvylshikimate-3-phosphate synthase